MGLESSCWRWDGASCPQRAGTELTQAAGPACETCQATQGQMASALLAPPGNSPRDAALLLWGRSALALIEPVGN